MNRLLLLVVLSLYGCNEPNAQNAMPIAAEPSSAPPQEASDETAPDETASDETAPDETASDETAPDETVSDETASAEDVSDEERSTASTRSLTLADGTVISMNLIDLVTASDPRLLADVSGPFAVRIGRTGLDNSELRDALRRAGQTYPLALEVWAPSPEDMPFIGQLTALRKLHLNGALIHDSDLVHLGNLVHLRSLNLNGAGFPEPPRQEEFGLGQTHHQTARPASTPLNGEGLAHLQGLQELRVLNLGASRLTTTTHLAAMTQLSELSLASSRVPDDFRFLQRLRHLRRLDLSRVGIGTGPEAGGGPGSLGGGGPPGEWLSDRHLAELRHLTRLIALQLDRATLTEAGLRHLRSLTSLQELSLRGTNIRNLASLTQLHNLRRLDLSNVRYLDDESLETIHRIPRLEVLRLHHLTNAGLAALAPHPALQELTVMWNLQGTGADLSDEAAPFLRELPNLRMLRLQHTTMTDAILPALQALEHLRRLDLRNAAHITSAIAEGLPAVQVQI